ncbi:murein transglycosylase [Roseobacter cerasinus]|uniref:Murein transglycosylase n=1 Tax=Roseobacter cerasinus TaxID=2602289 RepID=A0A640VX57_9RHOB|nr:lytic transglycosylase domain-containing protein [Roseobacter cerasinus]GFE51515.1 murein transglycosylase [Roseobacter cerasinus]
MMALIGLVSGWPAVAETPQPFPQFKAKRIGVPKAGQMPTIVQIDPEAQKAALALATPLPQDDALEVSPGRHGWFWDKVSPSLFDAGPDRLEQIMQVISSAGKIRAPRLQQMQRIAQTNGRDILRSTVGTRVSPALVLAVISVESAGRADALSGVGAQGLMQLMPDTAARFGVLDPWAAEENILGGVQYLDWLMQEFGTDPVLVLAGYNAGEGAVRAHEGVPPFAETRDYVPKVLAAFQVARGLCLTPPELITDGCVFAGQN